MQSLHTLAQEVFSKRRSGGALTEEEILSLGRWIDAQPELPASAPRDAQAAARGRAIFQRADVGCVTCHPPPTLRPPQ